jgi:hypothetical protein
MSKEGWNWCPMVTVHLNNDGLIVLSFQTNKKRGFEMLDWVS